MVDRVGLFLFLVASFVPTFRVGDRGLDLLAGLFLVGDAGLVVVVTLLRDGLVRFLSAGLFRGLAFAFLVPFFTTPPPLLFKVALITPSGVSPLKLTLTFWTFVAITSTGGFRFSNVLQAIETAKLRPFPPVSRSSDILTSVCFCRLLRLLPLLCLL